MCALAPTSAALGRAPRLVSPRLLGLLGDDRLAELVRHGNEAAFEALYDRHHRAILSFCRHMLSSPEDAEDCLQHTFAAAHATLAGSGRELSVRAWLFAVARNRCLDVLRARRDAPSGDLEEASTAGLSAEVERREDLRALLGDLGRLRDDQREALVLSELRALPHEEIAAVIGVPPAKVKALVYQARQNLVLDRQARETPCAEVRETLAVPTSGALRAPLRRHLAGCEGCRAFRADVRGQRRALAILLPVVPGAGLKASVLGLFGGGTGGTGAGLVAALGLGGGKALGGSAAVIALLAGGGAVATVGMVEHQRRADPAPARAHATPNRAAPTVAAKRAATPRPATLRGAVPSLRPAATPKKHPATARTIAAPRAKTSRTAATTPRVDPAPPPAKTPTRAVGHTDSGTNARGRALGNRSAGRQNPHGKAPTPRPAAKRPVKAVGNRPAVPPGQAKKTAAG